MLILPPLGVVAAKRTKGVLLSYTLSGIST